MRSLRAAGAGWAGARWARRRLCWSALSWGWLTLATSFDAGLSIRQSGMVQRVVEGLPELLQTPFVTIYGLAQPVLPAALADPAPLIWKAIAILRAGGLVPAGALPVVRDFRLLARAACKDRRILVWMALAGAGLAAALLDARRRRPVG